MLYIGVDVHRASSVISVRSADGVVLRRETVATSRAELRKAFGRIRSRSRVAVESGPMASWVANVLANKTREVVICEGRHNRLILHGTKTDRIDADKLSELLRVGAIRPVFLADEYTGYLRQLVHHYLRLMADRSRVVQRLRAFVATLGLNFTERTFSRRAVPLRAIHDRRAKFVATSLLAQTETLAPFITEARERLIAEARRHPAFDLLQTMPFVGPIRTAQLIAAIGTPHRFRSVRQFWAFAGLGVERRISAEVRISNGRASRSQRLRPSCRLNRNYHPRVKKVMKDVALGASLGKGVLRDIYNAHVARGKQPSIARVALARRIAAILFAMWKSDVPYDPSRINIHEYKGSGRASNDR